MSLRVDDWVEVRSKEEILVTLDATAALDGLPFMPEMFEYCGRRFKVSKRAHKTCDPPNGVHGRRMKSAVHLEGVRCDGAAHGGCQAGCLIFWKEAWLRKVDQLREATHRAHGEATAVCGESDVIAAVRRLASGTDSAEGAYVCQSTEVRAATDALKWWDVRQYVEDVTSGNVGVGQLLLTAAASACHTLATAGLGMGTPLRWIYDHVQRLRGGTPYPWRKGQLPLGSKTPSATLNLQPGEVVRVRSYAAILATLDENSMNRGMYFDAEMVPFCGGTYRVLRRVRRIIDEKTGHIQHLKNECIVLEDVECRACYAKYRRFCPRAIYPYWREIWLERVASGTSTATTANQRSQAIT